MSDDLLTEGVNFLMEAKIRADEEVIRELLGRWVSELEPSIARDRTGRILGLVPADTPIGSKPVIFK